LYSLSGTTRFGHGRPTQPIDQVIVGRPLTLALAEEAVSMASERPHVVAPNSPAGSPDGKRLVSMASERPHVVAPVIAVGGLVGGAAGIGFQWPLNGHTSLRHDLDLPDYIWFSGFNGL